MVSIIQIVSGAVRMGFWTGSVSYISPGSISTNTWSHLCMTYDGTTLSGYINAGTPTTGTYTKSNSGSTYWTLGDVPTNSSNFGTSVWLTGSVAVWKIYNRALTASEVLQNFSSLRGRFGV